MPSPTNPPCSGSCPLPPPETIATLPSIGASALAMYAGSSCTVIRSACASAIPCRASVVTVVGSLMIFFTTVLSTLIGNFGDGSGTGTPWPPFCAPADLAPPWPPLPGWTWPGGRDFAPCSGFVGRMKPFGSALMQGRWSAGSGCNPQPHRQAGDAALQLLELRDVNWERGVAEIGDEFRGSGCGRRHHQPTVAEIDDVGAGFLGHRPEMWPECRVVDQR